MFCFSVLIFFCVVFFQYLIFFFQAEDGIRDLYVTGVQTCALPISWARRRLATFEDADRGLCFGRLDLDSVDASLYVGRRWVHEDDVPLVVNWQAPAARPFYTATVAEPLGVTLRRRFRVEGRT